MEDLKELKMDVKELLQRSAVHNELLRTHENRSLALQSSQEKLSDRMTPIEKHVSLINAVGKVVSVIFVGVLIQALVRYFLSM